MGIVALAEHEQKGTPVAIKCLRPELAGDEMMVATFLREARAAARLRGERVCRVSEVGTLDNGIPYMVMEFMEGMDMRELVRTQGPLASGMMVDFFLQACEALAEVRAPAMDELAPPATSPAGRAKTLPEAAVNAPYAPMAVQDAATARVRVPPPRQRSPWPAALAVVLLAGVASMGLGIWLGARSPHDIGPAESAGTGMQPAIRLPVVSTADSSAAAEDTAPPAPKVQESSEVEKSSESSKAKKSSESSKAKTSNKARTSSESSEVKKSSKSSRRKAKRSSRRASKSARKARHEDEKPVDKIYGWIP